MFNIFKKKQVQPVQILTKQEADVQVSKASYPPEVMQIHHEFAHAAENLVIEANSIIAEAATKDAVKVSRLEKLGFKRAQQVAELRPLLDKAVLSTGQIEMVKYYQQNYPNNKFITEEQVKTICFKYNLVCGDVSKFKGFVPEKNLRDIENFKLNEAEANEITVDATPYPARGRMDTIQITIKDFKIIKIREYYHLLRKNDKNNTENYAFQSDNGVDFYAKDRYNLFGLVHIGDIQFSIDAQMQICAPIKDMDTTGMNLTDGYKLKKHVPDPVVLQRVNGGYLILTMWGPEAEDPMLLNEINN